MQTKARRLKVRGREARELWEFSRIYGPERGAEKGGQHKRKAEFRIVAGLNGEFVVVLVREL